MNWGSHAGAQVESRKSPAKPLITPSGSGTCFVIIAKGGAEVINRRQKGFTLIELMIVILIIAILVAIAVPVYLAATNSAKRRTCQSNLRTIDSAINAYNGYYDMMPGNGTCAAVLSTTWLKRDPTCPSSAAP